MRIRLAEKLPYLTTMTKPSERVLESITEKVAVLNSLLAADDIDFTSYTEKMRAVSLIAKQWKYSEIAEDILADIDLERLQRI